MLQISRKVRGRNGVATGKVRSRYVQGTFKLRSRFVQGSFKIRDRFGVASRKVRDSFGIIQTESAQKSRFLSRFLFAVMEILHKFDIGNIVTIYKVMNYNTGKTEKSDFKGTGKQGDSKMVARG